MEENQGKIGTNKFTKLPFTIEEIKNELNQWHNFTTNLELRAMKLHEANNCHEEAAKNAKQECDNLYKENSKLKSIICGLQSNVLTLFNYEEQNKELLESIQLLKDEIATLKTENKQCKENFEKETEAIRHSCKIKCQELKTHYEDLEKQQLKTFEQKLALKKNENQKMKSDYVKSESIFKEQQEKCSIMYEEKIRTLQQQLTKNTTNMNASSNSTMSDIFRKKLQHMQQDYEQKIATLNEKIQHLEQIQEPQLDKSTSKRTRLSLSHGPKNFIFTKK